MGGARGWMFTLNNPTLEETPELRASIQFIVYQREIGKEGTPHYQGYVLFKGRTTMKQCKEKYLWLARAHLEVRQKTNEVAIAYCTKLDTRVEGTEPTYLGERPLGGQGKSKKLVEACEAIREGTKIAALDPEYDCTRVVFSRGLEKLAADVRREHAPAWREVETLVLYGTTGLGKTRYAYSTFGAANICKVTEPPGSKVLWFDSYVDQDVLLIDDFSGWIPYRYFLTLLDGYPIELPIKGSFVPALFTKVIITSNDDPELWYPQHAEYGALPAPLARRLTKVRNITVPLIVHPSDSDGE